MDSENKILKIIHGKGGKASLGRIAREAGFGIDYTRYIARQLVKRGLLVSSYGKDLFKVSARGKKRLEPPRVEKSRDEAVKRKTKAVKKKRKPAKRLVTARHALVSAIKEEIPIRHEDPPKVVLAHNLQSGNEEKKLNVWSAIKKAARYLSEISPEDKNPKE